MIGAQSILLVSGQGERAAAAIDTAIRRGLGGSSLFLLAAPVVPSFRQRAAAVAAQDRITYGEGYNKCPYPARLWELGVWEAESGRPEGASSVARELRRRRPENPWAYELLLAQSLEAHATLAQGDTAEALRRYENLVAAPVPGSSLVWDVAAPRGLDRLRLAQLLMARGEFRRASDIAAVFDAAWPLVYLLYLPESLRLRAEAADALGDTRAAFRYRTRLDSLGHHRVVVMR